MVKNNYNKYTFYGHKIYMNKMKKIQLNRNILDMIKHKRKPIKSLKDDCTETTLIKYKDCNKNCKRDIQLTKCKAENKFGIMLN